MSPIQNIKTNEAIREGGSRSALSESKGCDVSLYVLLGDAYPASSGAKLKLQSPSLSIIEVGIHPKHKVFNKL